MLTPTHLIVAVLIGMLMTLDRDEWFIALTFGVLIDADHLFALPRYVSDNGWAAIFRPTWNDASGLPWKSLLHYPVGAAIVAPLAVGWRFLLPLTFWAVHVGLDELQNAALGYSTWIESALLVGTTAGIVSVSFSRWRAETGNASFQCFVRDVGARVRLWIADLRLIRTRAGRT